MTENNDVLIKIVDVLTKRIDVLEEKNKKIEREKPLFKISVVSRLEIW